jgi:hypothetical protein
MQRRTSSQIYSRQSGQSTNNPQTDELIANIAKSLMQSQNSPKNQSPTNNNDDSAEIKALLERISAQLNCMQQTSQAQQSVNNSPSGEQLQGQQEETPEEPQVTAELQNLFKQLLNGQKDQKNGNQQSSSSKNSEQIVSGGGAQSNLDSKGILSGYEQASKTIPENQNKMTAQTAAQALAQAQYELSTELEASLKKLKQVISESEKLANKISNLLGEENKNQG